MAKSQILFHDKSTSKDFVRKTLELFRLKCKMQRIAISKKHVLKNCFVELMKGRDFWMNKMDKVVIMLK